MRRMLLFALCILGTGFLPGEVIANPQYDELSKQAAEYKAKGDWANLEAVMSKALKLDSSDEYVGRTYSWAQMLQGKTEEAVKSAQENVRRHPCGWSYEQLAEAYWSNADTEAARSAVLQALAMEKKQKSGAYDTAKATYDRLARKHYHFEFTIDPETKPTGPEFVMGVPTLSNDHQSGIYKVVNAQSVKEFHDPGGNLLLRVVRKGNETFQLVVDMIVVPYSMKSRFSARSAAPLPDDLKVYLGKAMVWHSWGLIDPSSKLLKETVKPLKSQDDVQTVRNIAKWMSRIRYQEIVYQSVDDVIIKGYGHCDATASLMTGLCRAAGIPARNLRIATMEAAKESGTLGGHSMCEVYIKGVGWTPVNPGDPMGLGRCDSNWIRMFDYGFEGSDIRLFNLGNLDRAKTSFSMHYEE
ncbi:MAG TPA: transglutaminase domain-containing protein [Armatimonadota bacterium]|nr:transglutaminase domain-containing protein [Armatimonadota bacterium]